MEEIIALNSWKLDLGHKTEYCGPQRPKSDRKAIGQCVRMRVRLETIKVLELRNSKLKFDIG